MVDGACGAWVQTAKEDLVGVVGCEGADLRQWGAGIEVEVKELTQILHTRANPRPFPSMAMQWLSGVLRSLAGASSGWRERWCE
ncbi:MAG: hypothetical protein ACKN94_01745, partial [Pirellulaceae bacterium]